MIIGSCVSPNISGFLPGPLSVSLNTVPDDSTAGYVVGTASSNEVAPTFTLSNDDGGNFAIDAVTGQITLTSTGATAFGGNGAQTRTIVVSDGTNSSGNLTVQITAATSDPILWTDDDTMEWAA